MIKVFITGADGFIASHLIEYLATMPDIEIYGTRYMPQVNIKEYEDKVHLFNCDVRDKDVLKDLIFKISPDVIFHLAAQSYPTVSWANPVGTINDNVLGTINVFEAIKELSINPVVFVACSSAVYGLVNQSKLPVREDYPLLPVNPYGVSKLTQDALAYQYYKNFGIKTIRARIFNTTGPRKIRDAIAEFAQQIARIEAGQQEPVIKVGNLDTRRDITDGRDMVKAFWLSTQKGQYGEAYNFCSNQTVSIKEVLNSLIKMSKVNIKIEVDPAKIRPSDEPVIQGSNEKLVKIIGWKPEIPFEKTLQDTLDYWRKKYGVK